MTWLIGILFALLLVYVVMCVCGLLLLPRLVFPGSGPLLFPLPRWEPQRAVLPLPDGVTLSGWEIHRPEKRGPPVLYFGGNAEQVGLGLSNLMLMDARFIATYSYRGYGMSSGRATFSNTINDGLLLARRLAEIAECQTSELVLVGRSLGAAIAVQVAAQIPVGGLILISPFSCLSSMTRHVAPWFPSILVRGTLNSLRASRAISAATLFILAEDDAVIPPAETERLHDAWNEPKLLTRLVSGGHNCLHEHESYHHAIDLFLHSRTSSAGGLGN